MTNDNLAMSVNVLVGRQPGPTLLVSAALHGDEIIGVEIIRRLLRQPALRGLNGVLLAIPVVNVHGFLHQTRYLPDGRDLNRSFPGSSRGSLAARVADKFLTVLGRCDYAVDLHTGARHRANLPQIRVDLEDEPSKALGMSFGVPVMMHSKLLDGSVRKEAAARKIPFLLYESGESLRFDEFSIRVGVRGVMNVMRHLGMLRQSPRRKTLTKQPLISRRAVWVRATTSGVLRSRASLGSEVSEGDLLGIIGDPMGTEETAVRCTEAGIIIGKSNLPLVSEGDAIFHIACYRDQGAMAEQAYNDLQVEVGTEIDPDNLLGL